MNTLLKGTLFVAFGASSYGMLATFVKLAYEQGFTTAEVTTSQYVFALTFMMALNYFTKNNLDMNLDEKYTNLFSFNPEAQELSGGK